jgi:hypothetical protein
VRYAGRLKPRPFWLSMPGSVIILCLSQSDRGATQTQPLFLQCQLGSSAKTLEIRHWHIDRPGLNAWQPVQQRRSAR